MFRNFSIFAVLILSSFWASNSWTHTFDPERLIVVDSSKGELEVLVTYREAPGKRLDYLLGIYDQNKDGILSKQESLAVAPALKKIALSGLAISIPLGVEKTRVKYKSRDGLSIALLYRLPKTVKTLTFQFNDNKKHIMTSVHFIGPALSFLNGNSPTRASFFVDSGSFGIFR